MTLIGIITSLIRRCLPASAAHPDAGYSSDRSWSFISGTAYISVLMCTAELLKDMLVTIPLRPAS